MEEGNPADRWFLDTLHNAQDRDGILQDAAYEAIGPHFQSNPYDLTRDTMVRHGTIEIELPERSFDGIREYLQTHAIEGIVFWKDGAPRCKIKRKDFGFKWPIKQVDLLDER